MRDSAGGDTAPHPNDTEKRGRDAASPRDIPAAGWREVLARTWKESSADNVGLIAAGVAFYVFLALVPLLASVVLIYGLVASPESVVSNMQALTRMLPDDVAQVVGQQLMRVVESSESTKGVGLLMALGVSLFGARNAVGGVISALNIAYEEEEKRGFITVNLLAIGMTLAAVVALVFALLAVTALGFIEHLLPSAAPVVVTLLKIVPYVVLALGAALVAAFLYRFGPSRDKAEWQWLTPGGVFFAVAWVLLTLGFGIYVANFGNYGATYGSLSAVIVLLTWLYLSSYALLFGAELNSELEHQTARDTTVGHATPLGTRDAWAADHVAEGAEDAGENRDLDKPAKLPDGVEPSASGSEAQPEPSRSERRERLSRLREKLEH